MKQYLISICTLFLFSLKIYAQGEGNIWYFGFNAGMDFNPGSPTSLTNGALYTTEGCASISTSTGNLLFYTDGITVWNKFHNPMPNGTGLMGDPSSTQSGIIVPKPGSTTNYYVFTTAATGGIPGLRYSEVDMSLSAGLGDVTSVKNIALFTPVTEKLTAVKHSNGTDFWVIAHDNNSNNYLVYSVTSAGVNATPIISATGTFDATTYGIGYLKASPDGSKLVAVHDFAGVVDLLSFNTGNGSVLADFTFTPPFSNPYGGEFSPDGTRLYISSESSANVYQYDMTLANSSAIIASGVVIGTSNCFNLGCLQNGPDGKMYVAKYGFQSVACIPNPNSLGTACGFNDNAVNLAPNFCRLGFPNIISTFLVPPAPVPIQYANTCLGNITDLWYSDSLSIDSIHWNFGDPSTGLNNYSSLYAPTHVFSGIGNYTVTVTTYFGGLGTNVNNTVTITTVPLVDLGNDTVLCSGNTLVLDAGSTPCIWQDLSGNQLYTVSTQGTYYVNVSNSCGTTSDTIICNFKPTPVVIINNATICLGDTASLNVSGANSYTWPTGVTPTGANTAITSPNITSSFVVTGTTNGCSSTATSLVTVNQLPDPSFSSSDISDCYPACIQFTKTGSGAYAVEGFLFDNGDTLLGASAVHCYDTSGTYQVTFFCTDGNGCSGSVNLVNPIVILDPIQADFTFTPNSPVKVNSNVSFTNLSSGSSMYDWNFDDLLSGTANTSNLNSPEHIFNTKGTYCIELIATNTAGCIDTSIKCIEVIEDIIIPNIFTPNGDLKNDVFYIDHLQLGLAKVQIFNRWGNIVYTSEGYMNDWTGAGVSDGIYYYVIDYSFDKKTYTGFVQIIDSK